MESGGFCRILSVSRRALCGEADVPQHVCAWCVQLRTHPWGTHGLELSGPGSPYWLPYILGRGG